MKKLLLRFIEWGHAFQVISVLVVIPQIWQWIHGHATPLSTFVIGWNLGGAVSWQYYLVQRKRTKFWMERAIQPKRGEFEEVLGMADKLVEARMRSAHIDADRN